MIDVLRVLRRRWHPFVAGVVLGLAAGSVLTLQTSPSYRAESQLFVAIASSAADDSAASLSEASYVAANRVPTYPGLVTSPAVLQPVIDELGLDTTPADLAQDVAAQVPPGTVLVEVYADAGSPERAAVLADAVARSLVDVIETLDRPGPESGPVVRVTQVREAVPPAAPRSPVPLINLAAGLVAGLVVGVGGSLLRESLDVTLRGGADVTAAGLPLLAEVPLWPLEDQPPVRAEEPGHGSAWSEVFRRLRVMLDRHAPGEGPRTLVVAGAGTRAGTTTSASHLAAAFAATGRRTVLVDADLRHGGVAPLLGLDTDVGVTTALSGGAGVDELPQRAGGLDVVTAGPTPPNPAELLESRAFADLVVRLRSTYDVVVIDAPALRPTSDAFPAARVADAVVVVCRHRGTRRTDVHDAAARLREAGAPVVGAVLTGVPEGHASDPVTRAPVRSAAS